MSALGVSPSFPKAFRNASNKYYEVSSGAFTVKFEHISQLFLLFIVDCVQANICWDRTSNLMLESLSSIRILQSLSQFYRFVSRNQWLNLQKQEIVHEHEKAKTSSNYRILEEARYKNLWENIRVEVLVSKSVDLKATTILIKYFVTYPFNGVFWDFSEQLFQRFKHNAPKWSHIF